MKLINTIPYNQTQFKFVSNHYDLHLEGLCTYKGETCYFQTLQGNWNEENDEWDQSFCEIYKLSIGEKWKWFWRKKKFEWMVGYHWSYPQRKQGKFFYYRKPTWLYRRLFRLFYKR
jgi:hypothetical protein